MIIIALVHNYRLYSSTDRVNTLCLFLNLTEKLRYNQTDLISSIFIQFLKLPKTYRRSPRHDPRKILFLPHTTNPLVML